MIYETKGLSLEQVDEMYEKVNRAWNSPGFVPTVSFREEVRGLGSISGAGAGAGKGEGEKGGEEEQEEVLGKQGEVVKSEFK